MLSVLLVLLALALAAGKDILVTFGVPSNSKHSVGLYWTGNPDSPRISTIKPWFGNSDAVEMLVQLIEPGLTQSEQAFAGSSFVVRSADLTTRVRVTISHNKSADRDRPYTIAIVNLSVEDRLGPFPIELQHSTAGFVWIDPSDVVEHVTGPNHIFTVRDKKKQPVFSVTINGPVTGEL